MPWHYFSIIHGARQALMPLQIALERWPVNAKKFRTRCKFVHWPWINYSCLVYRVKTCLSSRRIHRWKTHNTRQAERLTRCDFLVDLHMPCSPWLVQIDPTAPNAPRMSSSRACEGGFFCFLFPLPSELCPSPPEIGSERGSTGGPSIWHHWLGSSVCL